MPSVPLLRGLASIHLADDHGLVHYPGERNTTLIGVGLVLLIPIALVLGLVAHVPWLATLLFGVSFAGLPALAFLDARRAGAQNISDPEHMAPSAPTLPTDDSDDADDSDDDSDGASDSDSSDDDDDDYDDGSSAERGPFMVMRGEAHFIGESAVASLSQTSCLVFRLDIRAGADSELVARYTSDTGFAVTCADGSQAIVTGVIELTGSAYQTVEPSDRAHFEILDTALLPARFTHGGWACEIAVRQGDQVQVQGHANTELRAHPLGTSYRQPGVIPVLCGTPGQPIVVSVLSSR